jgi:hypothetical protein
MKENNDDSKISESNSEQSSSNQNQVKAHYLIKVLSKKVGQKKNQNLVCLQKYHLRKSKIEKLQMIRQEQDTANWELRTISIWRLGDTMLRLGIDPKTANKFRNYGKVYREGSDNTVEFRVLEGKDQLAVNKGFTDPYCSQAVCYVDPIGVEDIAYVNADLEKYDRRYGKHADGDAPYKSFNLEADKLIRRYNKEKAEQLIFNNMSDRGKRKMAKIPLRYD